MTGGRLIPDKTGFPGDDVNVHVCQPWLNVALRLLPLLSIRHVLDMDRHTVFARHVLDMDRHTVFGHGQAYRFMDRHTVFHQIQPSR